MMTVVALSWLNQICELWRTGQLSRALFAHLGLKGSASLLRCLELSGARCQIHAGHQVVCLAHAILFLHQRPHPVVHECSSLLLIDALQEAVEIASKHDNPDAGSSGDNRRMLTRIRMANAATLCAHSAHFCSSHAACCGISLAWY